VSLLYCVSSVFLFLHLFYFIAPRSCFSNNAVEIESNMMASGKLRAILETGN
jgi:hypothetical protein